MIDAIKRHDKKRERKNAADLTRRNLGEGITGKVPIKKTRENAQTKKHWQGANKNEAQ